jgi:hypothetical protein
MTKDMVFSTNHYLHIGTEPGPVLKSASTVKLSVYRFICYQY